jgi:riboflavin synthase
MFTGIVTAIGHIVHTQTITPSAYSPNSPKLANQPSDHGIRLGIQAPAGYLDDVQLGDSIALNGACMTAIEVDTEKAILTVEVSQVSLKTTVGLGRDGVGHPLNMEKALRSSDRLGGHIVSGHVDGVGQVIDCYEVGESRCLVLETPATLGPYLVVKGSITVQGVSLTINALEDGNRDGDALSPCRFSVNVIPHTQTHTTLGRLQKGDWVNLETDVIARHVTRYLQPYLAKLTPS